MNKKRVILFSVVFLYAIGVSLSCVFVYFNSKQTLMAHVDQQLLSYSKSIIKDNSINNLEQIIVAKKKYIYNDSWSVG